MLLSDVWSSVNLPRAPPLLQARLQTRQPESKVAFEAWEKVREGLLGLRMSGGEQRVGLWCGVQVSVER